TSSTSSSSMASATYGGSSSSRGFRRAGTDAGRACVTLSLGARGAVFADAPFPVDPGITMMCWHVGHLPLRPACSSAAEMVVEQAGHGNLITKRLPDDGKL